MILPTVVQWAKWKGPRIFERYYVNQIRQSAVQCNAVTTVVSIFQKANLLVILTGQIGIKRDHRTWGYYILIFLIPLSINLHFVSCNYMLGCQHFVTHHISNALMYQLCHNQLSTHYKLQLIVRLRAYGINGSRLQSHRGHVKNYCYLLHYCWD